MVSSRFINKNSLWNNSRRLISEWVMFFKVWKFFRGCIWKYNKKSILKIPDLDERSSFMTIVFITAMFLWLEEECTQRFLAV
ncbi:Uncharacterised protein [Serratia fonticola]|nr:Uncharacterised protein [Serratia fonticola]